MANPCQRSRFRRVKAARLSMQKRPRRTAIRRGLPITQAKDVTG